MVTGELRDPGLWGSTASRLGEGAMVTGEPRVRCATLGPHTGYIFPPPQPRSGLIPKPRVAERTLG